MKNFRLNLIIRILLITASVFVLFYFYFNFKLIGVLLLLIAIIFYQVFSLIKYIDRTNKDLTRFFQSIEYSDFSQSFGNKKLGKSFDDLRNEFNKVIQKFKKTRSEKEEQYRYFQTIVQHIGIGVITFKTNGEIKLINNAAKRILKISHLKNISALDNIENSFSNKILKLKSGEKTTLKLLINNELVQLLLYKTEFKLRQQSYALVSLQNIQSELDEKEIESWQKLIRVLTHEIMNSITPITSLAATANTIIDKAPDNILPNETTEDLKSAVETIHKRSKGLLEFVEKYRTLTKIPRPDFKIFPIQNLFENIKKLMENEFSEKNIQFAATVQPESLELTADQGMIEQVLLNLIINSVQSLSKKENGIIKLTAELTSKGKVLIKVIDNGIGISKEVQEKIFIPFFTTKTDGSGIGLSLSKQIILLHGGGISVSSNVDSGTIFTLSF